MYESKLKQVVAENFGTIEYGVLEFDSSNMINLVGYNDSGKSNILRMLCIILYDAMPLEQVRFVKDGKDYWRGTLLFDDNVRISKTKMLTGVSIWEMYVGDKMLYTNKVGNAFSSTKGVPYQIKTYLGVLQDEFTKQLLNVRFNTDKLFLIHTSGSENYKMLSYILNSDVLAEASAELIKDKNKMMQDVQIKNNSYNLLMGQYNDLDVPPEELLDELDDRIKKLTELNMRGKQLDSLETAYKAIQSTDVYPEIKPIDTGRYAQLLALQESYAASQAPVQPQLTTVPIDRMNQIVTLVQMAQKMSEPIYPSLTKVDTSRINAICDLIRLSRAYTSTVEEYNKVDTEYSKLADELEKIAKETNFKVCPNCKTVIV